VDDIRDRIVRKGDYVYGSFLKPESIDGYINASNPGDRSDILGRFPFAESSVNDAVECAKKGARTWRRSGINDRVVVVRRFRDHLARAQERIARLVTRETGKAIWEARQEVLAAIRALDLYLEESPGMLAPRVIEELGARSDRLPRGVVSVLCPFNFPVLIPTSQVGAAILAGNAVVVKPSKFTPGVGQSLAELWDRCKLPRGVFNMVQGPGSVIGQRLTQHPDVDAVVFTGSYAVATLIRQATLDRPELPVVMQCGGKGVAVVLDDAEVDRAVYEVMVGAFLTSGQRHNSTGRVIVTEGIYEAFVSMLVRQTSRLSVGYGFDTDVFMGPLISENLRSRYRRFARALVGAGHAALIEARPERLQRRGFYARPSIFRVFWENGSPFLADEPPGPTLLIYKVSNWEEAVALHNQCAFRASTSLFCRGDAPYLGEVRDRLRTGGLNINRGSIGASLRLPSVGLGRSSNGISGGLELVQVLSHPRSQLIETRPFTGSPVLPGTNWNLPPASEPAVEVVEDTDESDDLSASLELSAE
jgi:succinylglutamic semialdehyde dehydrogenase